MLDRKLLIPLILWWRLHRQLRARSAGIRESGAFLLGHRRRNGVDNVRRFACYDDLDHTSLASGYIEFHSSGYSKLWKECRRRKMDVLGDVHCHPGSDFSQSETDRTHPMISESGYIGMILPCYAKRCAFSFTRLSVYEYEGSYRWRDWSGERRPERVRFTWW